MAVRDILKQKEKPADRQLRAAAQRRTDSNVNRQPADQSALKRTRTICAGLACVLAAVLVLTELLPGMALLPDGYIGTGPSNTSGLMILSGAAVTAWCFSVYLRCSDAIIKRNITLISALLLFWLLVVLVRYPVEHDRISAVLWYMYYIPMQFIPALIMASACRAAAIDGKSLCHNLLIAAFVLNAAIVLVILTNNFHHFAFAFDFADPQWGGHYTYNWAYWVAIVLQVAQYLCFFAVAVPAARRQLHSAFAPLLVIVGIGGTYTALYVLRNTAFFSTNIALVCTTLIVVSLELSLDLGIFPSSRRYEYFFTKLPFDLKILSLDRDVVMQTNCALPLKPEVEQALKTVTVPHAGTALYRTSRVPSTVYKLYAITGGCALLAEDTSTIDKRREELYQQQETLRRTNAILAHDHEVKRNLYRQTSSRELFEEIERSLSSKTRRIKELLDNLPRENDTASREARRESLMEVKLLVAYCKRKGGLILAEKSDPDFNRERLELVFNETASDLRSLNIDCAALVETAQVLPATTVSVLYDCLYDFAAAAFAAQSPILMLFVRDAGSGKVEMRAALEADCALIAHFEEALEELHDTLTARGDEFLLSISKASASLDLIVGQEA